MKLPLFILPAIIGTSEQLNYDRLKKLLLIFIGAVFLSTIISTLILFGVIPYNYTDIREISYFISHIRFSLMIVVSILIMLYWMVSEGVSFKKHIYYVIACVWFFFFLILLKSLTGIIVLLVTVLIIISLSAKYIKNQFLKIGLILVLYTIPIFSIIYIVHVVNFYNSSENINLSKLPKYTQNGKPYYHDTLNKSKENSHFIYLYINQEELEKEWNKRSSIPYTSLDHKKQLVSSTLIRYLTSKGLRKDSAGVWALSKRDIYNIENGITNFIYAKKASLFPRIYEVVWEIDNYIKYKDPNGHSVTQRIIYSKMAFDIFKTHPVFGVGTGDVKKEVTDYYKVNDTGLAKIFQRDIHNQYLMFLVAFGIVGFLIIIAAFIIPPILERKWKSYYFLITFIVLFLSFINEDTLETQVGVTFAALFYSLFVWGYYKKRQELTS
jgi:hypothetical protein